MKLTWTFYPKGQPVVTLSVVYVPELDAPNAVGFLETETNTAYVNWDSFRVFDKGSTVEKRALFGALIRLERFGADGS